METLVETPEAIAGVLAASMSKVYGSHILGDMYILSAFVGDLLMLVLAEEDLAVLDVEISDSEIAEAFAHMRKGWLPHRIFVCILRAAGAPFGGTLQRHKTGGMLPEDQRCALMVLIYKEGKPREECVPYHTISLNNVEAKVLAKVLADQLQWIVETLVKEDHSGFRPHRVEPSLMVDRRAMNPVRHLRYLYGEKRSQGLPTQTVEVLKTWWRAERLMGWKRQITLGTPLWDVEVLKKPRNNEGHKKWDLLGISVVGDLWMEGRLITFQELQVECKMLGSQYLRYLQMQHTSTGYGPRLEDLLDECPLEYRALLSHLPANAITLVYTVLLAHSLPNLTSRRDCWELDLGILEDDAWGEACRYLHDVTIREGFCLVQMKLFHTVYFTR
ncbi:hypothetical protein NDU88_002997 [Pleurodeles waltl]|uniref:Reverse transcriptase domain-containing protein n=1 Tax=Pleurodeles waltl TaxID=8319 RepID=A0AAV7KX68_PLEWA|nr:hypothetical protein NDU88_002997 [Pleurodeles waltl]